MISTSIKLDGEQEFKRQLSSVNGELKNLNSDMKLVTEQFKGQANTLEALTEKDRILNQQVEQQTEKVRALEQALSEAAEAYGENDKRVDNYHRSLNEARTQLIRMQRELQDNSKYMDEARRSANQAASSIDGFGREVEQADNSMGGYGQTLQGFIGDLGKLKGALVGGAVIGAIKELGGAILEVEESTREYRQIMNGLMTSGEAAGKSAEDTADRYKLLQGVMGDTQAAAEATAQLQTLQATEKQLDEATLGVIGSWSKLGGAAPIETIAESISQTVAASQATGAFSDILMATGQNEEEFNAKLAETADASARLDLVLQTLAATGMKDLGESYLETNAAAIEANQTQDKLNASWAMLGEVLAPVANLIRNETADALVVLAGALDEAIGGVQELVDWWDRAKGVLAESGGLKGLFSWETLSKTPAQLEAEAQAARTMKGLTGAELRERGITSSDVYSAAAAAVSGADSIWNRGGQSGGVINTTINIDGREVARATQPYLREEDRSNPEVVSDLL